MQIKSPAFEFNEEIPSKFTCDGENINPTLEIEDIPEDTETLVLIVNDPDAPNGDWVHWIVYNIIPSTILIPENSVPGYLGKNDFNKQDYLGPCPHSGEHRYFFKVYALDIKLSSFGKVPDKKEIERQMKGHIIDDAELVGVYSRK